MATEHPMLDDNGDRNGSLEPKAVGDERRSASPAVCSSAPGRPGRELARARPLAGEEERARGARRGAARAARSSRRGASTCASSRPCCSTWRAPTKRSSGWRRPGEAGVAMAPAARESCGGAGWRSLSARRRASPAARRPARRPRRGSAGGRAARQVEAPAGRRPLRRGGRRLRRARSRPSPTRLEAQRGWAARAVRGRPLPGRRRRSVGVSRRIRHRATPRGIRLPLG